jgi:hypothetical protein
VEGFEVEISRREKEVVKRDGDWRDVAGSAASSLGKGLGRTRGFQSVAGNEFTPDTYPPPHNHLRVSDAIPIRRFRHSQQLGGHCKGRNVSASIMQKKKKKVQSADSP